MSDDLSLAISRNKSLQWLVLPDNNYVTNRFNKGMYITKQFKVLQLTHKCIIPSKVAELTSVITENTLLGGMTLNATESFHFTMNTLLHKTDYGISL